MNLLDFLIIILVLSQAVRWAEYGFSRGFFSLAGYWIGVILGAMIVPFFITLIQDPLGKLLVVLIVILGSASIVGSLGRLIGQKLFHLLNKVRLNWIDGIAGSVFSVLVTLGVVWLVAAMFSGMPFKGINQQIRGSAIIQTLDDTLPPAPAVLARIGGLINPNNFPQAFLGPEPQPIEPVDAPSSEEMAAALKAAGRSTVRIESIGCGGQLTGSGFVATEDLIVTNAHVIAGVNQPTVVDVNGRHRAEVVYFDPDIDLAVLRVDGELAGTPLALAESDYQRGTTGATLGYPRGGPLEAVPAAVLRPIDAMGLNIYGQRTAVRPIYILQTEVVSGNSGGPVVLTDGTVIGVIFARSEADDNTGYAIRSSEVIPALRQAQQAVSNVSTGNCVRS